MKDHLDWIEVGRILRQIAQARPDCRNGLFNTSDLVGRKVVDHDNISALGGLVEKYQSCGVQKPLLTNPASTRASHIDALLFRGA